MTSVESEASPQPVPVRNKPQHKRPRHNAETTGHDVDSIANLVVDKLVNAGILQKPTVQCTNNA